MKIHHQVQIVEMKKSPIWNLFIPYSPLKIQKFSMSSKQEIGDTLLLYNFLLFNFKVKIEQYKNMGDIFV